MKLNLLKTALMFLLVAGECAAQNLVPNWSFENYYSCPDDIGLIDSAVGWKIFGNCQWAGPGTPDYLNTCADVTQYPDSLASIPHNLAGYQYPATGNAYAGIICYAITVTDCREIIGCHLTSPLQIGQTYFVSFKANCSFGGYMGNFVASNGLGVKFSTIPYNNDHPILIDNSPMVYSTNIITDTLNWTKIEGTFIADSAYQYLAIGNFIQDAFLDTVHLGSFIFRSYYYIDDVSVTQVIADGLSSTSSSFTFSLSPNPTSTQLTITYSITHPASLTFTNTCGQVVKQLTLYPNLKNHSIATDDLAEGVYLVTLDEEGRRVSEKVAIVR